MQRENNREYEDVVTLDDAEIFSSTLIFGLRMNEGVDILSLKKRAPNADILKYERKLLELEKEKLLECEITRNVCGYIVGERVKLTREGRLLADYVGVELL